MARRALFPLLGALVLSGCCGQCSKVVGHVFEEVPEKEGKEKLVERLKTEKSLATSACGIPATGLTDVKFTTYSGSRGLIKAEIEGKPILDPKAPASKATSATNATSAPSAASAPKPTAGGVNPTKALVCVAVVSFAASSVRNEKDEITDWKVTSVYLDDVKTPGVSWTKPSSGGGWDD